MSYLHGPTDDVTAAVQSVANMLPPGMSIPFMTPSGTATLTAAPAAGTILGMSPAVAAAAALALGLIGYAAWNR